MLNLQPTQSPSDRSAWTALVLERADQWFRKLERLEQHGLYQAKVLESGTRKLLNVAYPEKGLYDANTRKSNHPAVDILSKDNKFGVQVKLTLRPGVIRESRMKWVKEISSKGSIPGATELWILGAVTNPSSPNKSSDAWAQIKCQEWAVITDKLRLDDLSVENLKTLCAILEEELSNIPNDVESVSAHVRSLHRLVRRLLKVSLLRKDQNRGLNYDDLYNLARTDEVREKAENLGAASEEILQNFKALVDFMQDVEFENLLEKLGEATAELSKALISAFETSEEQKKHKRAGRAHGLVDPYGEMLSGKFLKQVDEMVKFHEQSFRSARELQDFLENEFDALFHSKISNENFGYSWSSAKR